MLKSDNIVNIAKALLKFQAEAVKITKDAANPFFKSKYATLSNILDAIQKPLTSAGLAVSQLPEGDEELITMVIHAESGEFFQSHYKIAAVRKDPQSIGSAITYARRYALCAVLGLNIDDDDDGNAASGKDHNPAGNAGQGQQAQGNNKTVNNNPPPAPEDPFTKKYTKSAELIEVVKSATTMKQVSDLYNANPKAIEAKAEVKAAFSAKKLQLTPPVNNPAPLPIDELVTKVYTTGQDVHMCINMATTTAHLMTLHRNNGKMIDTDRTLHNFFNSRILEFKTAGK